jgi:hypothetical protein
VNNTLSIMMQAAECGMVDGEDVAGADVVQAGKQPWALGGGAGGIVGDKPLAAGGGEGVVLQGRVLLEGGDACVADHRQAADGSAVAAQKTLAIHFRAVDFGTTFGRCAGCSTWADAGQLAVGLCRPRKGRF